MRGWIAGWVLCLATVAQAAGISGQGTWESTLEARDVNGDGMADAYYDSSLDVTWLADANYVMTSGYADGGLAFLGMLTTDEAAVFVSKLDIYGIDGWRLPTAKQVVPAGVDAGFLAMMLGSGSYVDFVPEPSFSELAHLHYVTLGNVSGMPYNDGGFMNVQSDYLGGNWCVDAGAGLCGAYTSFSVGSGFQYIAAEQRALWVWAVHDGDIAAAPVPEPSTYLLLASGIAALGWRVRSARKA
jgi:hypothetical protein